MMRVKPGFILRKVVGEYLLMPAGESAAGFGGYLLLNTVSAFLWEQMQTPKTRQDLLDAVLAKYAIDEATASADLDAMLGQFRQQGLLEE